MPSFSLVKDVDFDTIDDATRVEKSIIPQVVLGLAPPARLERLETMQILWV